LQSIQKTHDFLPENELKKLSKKKNIPLTDIYGVATFYSQFKLEKPAKNKILVCDGTACHVRKSIDLVEELKKILKTDLKKPTDDGLFVIDTVRCLGLCASAPVIKINDKVYPKVNKNDLLEIIQEYKNENS